MPDKRIIIAIVSWGIITLLYAQNEDFCENIEKNLVIRSQTQQDKYFFSRLNDIAYGNKRQRTNAIAQILRVVTKARKGRCYIRFLEILNSYINDYINYIRALENEEKGEEISSHIKKYISNKIECLIIRNELLLSASADIPRVVCSINKCKSTLLYLYKAFASNTQYSLNIKVLSFFLKIFWRNYFESKKSTRTKIRARWEQDICNSINDIVERTRKRYKITNTTDLLDDEGFKGNVGNFIFNYFGSILLPECGSKCIDELLSFTSHKKLDCNISSQLLDIVASSLRYMFSGTKKVDKQLLMQLFETMEKLVKQKCYLMSISMDTLFFLELYNDNDIMNIVLNRIFPLIGSGSFDAEFFKYMLVAGFANMGYNIYDLTIKNRLLDILRDEFENTTNYDYKDVILRTLYALNDYKYLLKNKDKLFEQYMRGVKSLNMGTNIPAASGDFFLNTLLQVAGLYGLDNFRDFIIKNSAAIRGNSREKRPAIKDIQYSIILLSLFAYQDKNFAEKFLVRIVKGNFPLLVKQYALKSLLYLISRQKLSTNYLKKFSKYDRLQCFVNLIGALISDKTIVTKMDDIKGCKEIKLDTNAVKELLKIAIASARKTNPENIPSALNIFQLNFSETDKFVSYDTCGVGHIPADSPIVSVKNSIYAIEYDKKNLSDRCDKMVFISSLLYILLNNLTNPSLYKKLDRFTTSSVYKGQLKFIIRKIARELNATADFKALKEKNYKYLLNFYTGFILPPQSDGHGSLSSYKVLLTRISERFLVTFILTRTNDGVNIIKVVPFETAANFWVTTLQNYFSK
ncbi:MAG: hypothetical protein ACK4NF_00355 [Planctomycetota bacterium]